MRDWRFMDPPPMLGDRPIVILSRLNSLAAKDEFKRIEHGDLRRAMATTCAARLTVQTLVVVASHSATAQRSHGPARPSSAFPEL